MSLEITPEETGQSSIERLLDGRLNFGFHFQPIVDLDHGEVAGYEALARFPAELRLNSQDVFELAARCGLGIELEALAMQLALEARAKLPPNCFLSVNVGPDLLQSEKWREITRSFTRLDGIVIEVTEQAAIGDYAALRGRLDGIREAGGYVAVDDTGAGFASLKHVMELRPNFIKLDRFFVGGCHTERARAAMIEMLGNAASRLDAWIVAEGVETAGELDELMHLKVPLAQGYYLGRPEPGMFPLSRMQSETIRNRARSFTEGALMGVLESCFCCREPAAAERYLEGSSDTRVVVLTDHWGRPVELMERHPLTGVRRLSNPMKTQSTSDLREVLLRGLTRAEDRRFDPIVALSEEGRVDGVLLMDRMMKLVLDTSYMEQREAELRAVWPSQERQGGRPSDLRKKPGGMA